MARVLLHSFATAGYLPWLELLLESARVHSGDRIHIRVDALNVEERDVERLHATYPNLRIENQHLAEEDMSREIGVSHERLAAWKAQIEDARVTDRNYLYKVFVSVSKRYRAMDRVLREAKEAGYQAVIHADADLYLRTDLSEGPLLETVLRNDVCAYVNDSLTALMHHRKVLGALLCFNLQGNIEPFVERWMAEIDGVPFLQRWKGYGQSVLWYTFNSLRNEVRICDLNEISDRFRASRHFAPEADVWVGSNPKLISIRLQKKLKLNGAFSAAAASRARCRKDLAKQRAGRAQ